MHCMYRYVPICTRLGFYQVLRDQKDPTRLMKKYELHAKDTPVVLRRGTKEPSDWLGRHLSLETRLEKKTSKAGKISILDFAEREYKDGAAAQVGR